jgi:hypothetical protein
MPSSSSVAEAVATVPEPGAAETDQLEIRTLGFRARVSGPAAVIAELRALYPPPPGWATPPEPQETAEIALQPASWAGGQVAMVDGEQVWATSDPNELLPSLEWSINNTAAQRLGRHYLLLHAGSMALGDRGLVLSAPSGSGKSTLVAGLLADGFSYLSDEVAVLEPESLRLLPFPKSVCVKLGSRETLIPLFPSLAADASGRRFSGSSIWYVTPKPDAWPTAPVPVRYVLFPRYVAGAETRLEPLPRPAALANLLAQSFSAKQHGARAIAQTVEMLRGADCYALTIGDLRQAVGQVRALALS